MVVHRPMTGEAWFSFVSAYRHLRASETPDGQSKMTVEPLLSPESAGLAGDHLDSNNSLEILNLIEMQLITFNGQC
jgi:hypothetical protein